jgi:hypothetical protein
VRTDTRSVLQGSWLHQEARDLCQQGIRRLLQQDGGLCLRSLLHSRPLFGGGGVYDMNLRLPCPFFH